MSPSRVNGPAVDDEGSATDWYSDQVMPAGTAVGGDTSNRDVEAELGGKAAGAELVIDVLDAGALADWADWPSRGRTNRNSATTMSSRTTPIAAMPVQRRPPNQSRSAVGGSGNACSWLLRIIPHLMNTAPAFNALDEGSDDSGRAADHEAAGSYAGEPTDMFVCAAVVGDGEHRAGDD